MISLQLLLFAWVWRFFILSTLQTCYHRWNRGNSQCLGTL